MTDSLPDMYGIGDVFSMPKPYCEKLRFRVREIKQEPHWDGPQYAMQLYSYRITKEHGTGWVWFNRSHDRHVTAEQMAEQGYRMVSRGCQPEQMKLFG